MRMGDSYTLATAVPGPCKGEGRILADKRPSTGQDSREIASTETAGAATQVEQAWLVRCLMSRILPRWYIQPIILLTVTPFSWRHCGKASRKVSGCELRSKSESCCSVKFECDRWKERGSPSRYEANANTQVQKTSEGLESDEHSPSTRCKADMNSPTVRDDSNDRQAANGWRSSFFLKPWTPRQRSRLPREELILF